MTTGALVGEPVADCTACGCRGSGRGVRSRAARGGRGHARTAGDHRGKHGQASRRTACFGHDGTMSHAHFGAHVTNAGLVTEYAALAKSPSVAIRSGLAAVVLVDQSPAVLRVVEQLLADTDDDVKVHAFRNITGIRVPPGAELCALVKRHLVRTGPVDGLALADAWASQCGGVFDVVIDELEKRVSASVPSTGTNPIQYAVATEWACRNARMPRSASGRWQWRRSSRRSNRRPPTQGTRPSWRWRRAVCQRRRVASSRRWAGILPSRRP